LDISLNFPGIIAKVPQKSGSSSFCTVNAPSAPIRQLGI
jgi:hypothetical protein